MSVSRRRFMQSAGVAGLGLVAGCRSLAPLAQPASGGPPIPRIGHLGAITTPLITEQLAALGYVEGQTILIEWRGDEGRAERLAQHVAELVNLKLDLILVAGTERARALRDATGTIPIVMHSGVDPVGAGLGRASLTLAATSPERSNTIPSCPASSWSCCASWRRAART